MVRAVNADEIRESFLSFFEQRDHRRRPSGSLVPPPEDQTVLLTTAGMQPFKPYFRGDQAPPHPRLTSCQKVFRTPDIEEVGITARHLTFFEMLGNFSFGDYFKQGAVEFALEFSRDVLGIDMDDVWITVFGGDEDLGLGPDEEAIACWRAVGIPEERIVHLGRGDNFWQAGPTGPCGPCSELYLDRGEPFGGADDRPGDDTERFLEFWNLVFMQYELAEDGSLTPLPEQNIDTGLGLDRMAAILQDVPSVYETDHFRPLVALGEELSGRVMGKDPAGTRALRILADHGRGMSFLIADGVVPSNEDRGYVLRRIMRRAIQQGRVLGIEGPFLTKLADRVIEVMGHAYPDLEASREVIHKWAAAEEENFGRTLAQGERLLGEIVDRAKADGTSWVSADDAFKLHDTFGFPFELTQEMLAGEGLSVDDEGFAELMEQARRVARAAGKAEHAGEADHDRVVAFARGAGFPSRFVGYSDTELETTIGAVEGDNGRLLAKLPDSPFYAEGGGQVSDTGTVETDSGRAEVAAVFRLGDDQAVLLDVTEGEIGVGQPARAAVDRETRLATEANHTATHLLHAALRERLGAHVRQAGSYVGPDKLRFDFTHGERLSPEEVADVEARVSEWVAQGHPVEAVLTSKDEAERLGAMALFGEKYGDVVRMVEIDEVSRELCGGTHVFGTGEVGLFHLTAETSSASNVRRIEAVTGREGAQAFRAHTGELREIASILKVPERDAVEAVRKLSERVRELSKKAPKRDDRELAESLVAGAADVGGLKVVTEVVEGPDPKELLALADRVRQTLGDAAVVLGAAVEGKANLVATFAPAVVERGAKAGDVIRATAEMVGGGGGGRDTIAQAGGKDPGKLPEALAVARAAIEAALS
ncbi:MAG: alanine--tRNA ligase [Thermoleophilaceae bacterium]|nr:alanine--tRNA ligase [Thermoleophilaceae bacterium]